MSLLDDDDKVEDKEAVQERRALPGETLDRDGVSWVSNYDELMNEEELEWSRKVRAEFKKKFVGDNYPHSWWPEMNTADKRRRHLDQIASDDIASGQYDDTWSVRDFHDNPALSQFPSKLAEQILRCWSWKNDKVFDPFAGHLSRPLLTNHFNRDYWGCDISKEFFDKTRNEILDRAKGGLLEDEVRENEKELVDADLRGNRVRLERRDSRYLDDIPDKWADFCYTSPPYFDVEFYGDENEQLGNANDEYQEFLNDIEQVLEHVHRILKPYSYAAFVVNDFRQDSGVNGLYPWHADLIKRGQEVGFQLHDITMYPTGRSAALFAEQQVWMESTAKVHEYIIVFRRWPDDWTPDSNDKWNVRGLWWDVYPSEKLIEYYGIPRFKAWLKERQKRDLDIDRWVDLETGDVKWENHPKHRDVIEENNGLCFEELV
ncbi:MAG: DNA methyltransferase [Halopenitus sp.]